MFAPAHLRVAHRDRAILGGSLVAIAAVAWLALWLWEGSPYGHYLHHDGVVGAGGPATTLAVGAAAFTIGWTLMIVAMMLPSSVPLVVTFGALVGRRQRPARLVALLLLGYLLVWAGFGFVAWIADRGIHAAVEALPWLAEHPQLIIGTTLLAAGLWQFSPLRDRCLDECRSPLGFVLNRWRGVSERREALFMGIAHGAFCVGCCWSLMLVMFGVGISSLTGMLVLGGITAIEKNLPQGRRLTRPLGIALVLAAVYAVAA
jgi:predicted metal-binding membrane protein